MASMDADSVSTILCTCKQTRFNIQTPNYRELDIEGLNIIVASGAGTATSGKSGPGKSKSKAKKSDGTEILNNAKLRLKAGERYALVGRNGTGKSTLLKAIAEKLIPGVPEETRIVILQQTNISDADTDEAPEKADARPASAEEAGLTVLEEVIERATSKHEVEREISVLSEGVESSGAYSALRSIRKVRHERLQKEFFLKDKDARLRSGARGWNARKALIAMEKKVAEFEEVCNQEEEKISSEDLAKETREAADLLADLQLQVEPDKIAHMESRARKILTGLGFSDDRIVTPVSHLSGGWKMRTSLAAALLQETDILILDEPTNFLDLLGIMWLQRHLESLADGFDPPTLILVSHDRDFTSLCTDLILIQNKDLVYFHGDLPTYEASQAEKRVHLTKVKEAQDRQKDHMEKTIQRNLREGKQRDDQNKIRQAKSRQKKLDDRWGVETNAKGGRFKLNRDLVGYHLKAREDIDIPQDERSVYLALPPPPDLRFPGSLISLETVSFRYPLPKGARKKTAANDSKLVLRDIDLSVGMGDRIGILGLNGSGKSTLIRLLVGEHDHQRGAGESATATALSPPSPTSGTLTMHPRLRLGYYAQHAVERLQQLGSQEQTLTSLGLLMREEAAANSSLASAVAPSGGIDGGYGGGEAEASIRASLARLGLPGRLASDVPIRRLSGGQLVRLELARVLARRPQLLVLDEVTTHLDYETVRALRRALRDWRGGVVLVSHDRWFMRGVVEGIVDDEEEYESGDSQGDDSDGEQDDGWSRKRRRVVYRLRGGEMKVLSKGTSEFETGLEKRVSKMAVDT